MIQEIDFETLGKLLKVEDHNNIEREVVVSFSVDELKEKFKEINSLKTEIALLEVELKNTKDSINGKIKSNEDRITQIGRIGASSGKLEMKMIKPTVTIYENGKVLVYTGTSEKDEGTLYHRERFDVDRIIPPYLLIDEKEKPSGPQKSLIAEIEKKEKEKTDEEIFNFPDTGNLQKEEKLLAEEMENEKKSKKKDKKN